MIEGDAPDLGARLRAILEHYDGVVPSGHRRWMKMRCCFHSPDNNPSAAYDEETGGFHCFTCGVAGNAVTLLMRVEGLSARDADARATEISGLPGAEQPGVGRAGTGRRGRAYIPPRLRKGN